MFRHKRNTDYSETDSRHRHHRIPLISRILMLIGLLTVLYFLITYGLIPVLAMLTKP